MKRLKSKCSGNQTLTVKAGRHWPNKLFAPVRSKIVEAEIMFHEDCAEKYTKPEFNYLNKLFGISPLFMSNHKNSGRHVWKYNADHKRIDIWFYIYLNGVSPQQNTKQKKYMFTVELKEKFRVKVIDHLNGYSFFKDGKLMAFYKTPLRRNYRWAYREGLYVGGNYVYDVDIHVDYKIL